MSTHMPDHDRRWRETATDSKLYAHLNRTLDQIAEHLNTARALAPGIHPNYGWLDEWLAKADCTAFELKARAEQRDLMTATRPEPSADALLDLVRDIEAAEAAGDVTDDGGVILRSIN